VDLGTQPLHDHEPPAKHVDAQMNVPDRALSEWADLAMGAPGHGWVS